jgi:hypothetical protein
MRIRKIMPDLNLNASLPGEALVIAIINARMEWLKMLPEPLRNRVLEREVENMDFWHSLLAPLRAMVKERE